MLQHQLQQLICVMQHSPMFFNQLYFNKFIPTFTGAWNTCLQFQPQLSLFTSFYQCKQLILILKVVLSSFLPIFHPLYTLNGSKTQFHRYGMGFLPHIFLVRCCSSRKLIRIFFIDIQMIWIISPCSCPLRYNIIIWLSSTFLKPFS